MTTSEALSATQEKSGKRVFIRTYGCQMNVYDSERMADLLRPLGYAAAPSPDDADLIILNTCHIREKAAEKVYSDLGRLKPVKERRMREGLQTTVAVAGCVAQAEGAEISARAPIVDMVIGPQAYHRLPELLARRARSDGDALETDFAADEKFDRLDDAERAGRQVAGPTAFVTVQEGCDKFCAFCVVPYTRGAEISRPAAAILAETRALAARGVREVTLLGQNVNAWRGAAPGGGADISLGALCRRIAEIDGVERVRFTTSHPRDMDDDLIAAFAEEPKLMPYLHLPVQTGSDKILKAMNRGHDGERYLEIIAKVRAARPDIAISGDFIVGFPGESEADFSETLELAAAIDYAAAFSFKYSRRPGTPAAALGKQIAEDVKSERLARLQALLEAQRVAFNERQIGRTLPVLFEKRGRHEGQLIGRSPYLQGVYLDAPTRMIGDIADVEIVGASANALAGRLAAHAEIAV